MFFILPILGVRYALVGFLRNLSLGPAARTPEERAAWIAKRAEEAANPPHAWLTVDWTWGAKAKVAAGSGSGGTTHSQLSGDVGHGG